jgi:hypothetical protein
MGKQRHSGSSPATEKVFVSAAEHGRRTLLVQLAQAEGIPRVLPNSGGVILIGEEGAIERALQQGGALAAKYEAARLRALVGVLRKRAISVPQEVMTDLADAERNVKTGIVEPFNTDEMQYLVAGV